MKIPVDRIQPNPQQPRRSFPTSELRELAESIRANGLIQPVTVEEAGDGATF